MQYNHCKALQHTTLTVTWKNSNPLQSSAMNIIC